MRAILVGFIVALASGAILPGQIRPSIGLAASDYPFLIQGSRVPGHGTLLEGEAVTSSYMPTRVFLTSGPRYVLGIGSQARFTRDRVLLDGVSLEMLSAGGSPQRILVAGVELYASAPGTRATIYTDRPDIVSVSVTSGEITVLDARGEPAGTVGAGTAMTFSETRSSLGIRIQEKRASLEIARIQMRQLEYLGAVEQERPGLRVTRERVAAHLVRASGGLLGYNDEEAAEELDPVIPSGLPAVNPEELLRATEWVTRELHQARLDLAGCGEPSCATPAPPAARNSFAGLIGTLPPPYPGCTLCRGIATPVEPEP